MYWLNQPINFYNACNANNEIVITTETFSNLSKN